MREPIRVTLTDEEMATARDVAADRQEQAVKLGLKAKNGCSDDPAVQLAVHYTGACGELAVAKALGIEWHKPVNTFKTGTDVGPYQVRTRTELWYELLVRTDDPDDQIFVLVKGRPPDLLVVGWTYGGNAKQKKWLKKHGKREAAYFVPDAYLYPMADLLRSIP